MLKLALQTSDTVTERIHGVFVARQLALQHHQAKSIAGQFGIKPLTAAGIKYAE